MQITGNLKLVRPTQQITEKFSKREFVVVTSEQYPNSIQLELQGQNCDIIDAYAEGQEIICNVAIRGRMWTNPAGEEKYFNTIVCTGIQPANSQNNAQSAPQTNNAPPMQNNPQSTSQNEEDHDDLPF